MRRPELSTVLNEFVRNPEFADRVGYFRTLAAKDSPAEQELAFSVLLNLSNSRMVKGGTARQGDGGAGRGLEEAGKHDPPPAGGRAGCMRINMGRR